MFFFRARGRLSILRLSSSVRVSQSEDSFTGAQSSENNIPAFAGFRAKRPVDVDDRRDEL